MDIATLLSENESPHLEFKQTLPELQKLAALMCAFANTSGGDLIIGVEDRTRRIVGLPEGVALDWEEKIAAVAANSVTPIIFPQIRIARNGGAALLIVHIEMGFQKPYRVNTGKLAGKTFVRVGSTTREADAATILMLGLRAQGLSWDRLPCNECVLGDLDRKLIDEYLVLRMERRGIVRPGRISASWMHKMHFAAANEEKARPTNGAVLLFHPAPHEVMPNSAIELARFKGLEGRDFLDKRSIGGPLWKMYDEALTFLRLHLPTAAQRSPTHRREVLAYPEIAFREFMINAICHRSYESTASTVRCAIFDDVVRITNPGMLPEGLALEDLGCGISVIRNPLIARVLNELGLIEAWGTGIQIAQQELAARNLPPASIEQRGFFLQVTSPWRWPKNLADREVEILREIATQGKITSRKVAAMFDISDRNARNILSSLASKTLIKKSGSTKGSEYTLVH